jgi:hypothetical protein
MTHNRPQLGGQLAYKRMRFQQEAGRVARMTYRHGGR